MNRIKKYNRLICLTILCVQAFSLYSQRSYDWIKDWHRPGVEHWAEYIIISPGYMGPNALPVPEIYDASLSRKSSLELGGDYKYMPGDETYSSQISFYYAHSKSIAFEVYANPYEWFTLSDALADKRRTIGEQGGSFGDVYLAAYIKWKSETDAFPDLSSRIALKTASGGNLNNARYTDSPGYFFDLAFGKSVLTEFSQINARIYGLVGFYVYQTNELEYLQNDAFLYGIGAQISYGKIAMDASLGGYSGYLDRSDKPMLWRVNASYAVSKKSGIEFRFEGGLRDYLYNGIGLAYILNF